MLGLGAIPGIALAVGMFFMPETPRWLSERGRDDDAKAALQRARRTDDVDDEMKEIHEVSEKTGRLSDVFSGAVRPMLIVGMGLAIFQQIVGTNTVIYYAPTILSFTGKSTAGAIGQTVFMGVTSLVFTIVAVLLLDRFGRRVFLLVGTAGLTVGLVLLGVFFYSSSIQDNYPWLALAAFDHLHRILRDGSGPGVLADDLGDLPAERAGAGDGRVHGRELVVQLHCVVHVPHPDNVDRQVVDVLAVCDRRRHRIRVLHAARARDEGQDAGGDRAAAVQAAQAPAPAGPHGRGLTCFSPARMGNRQA
jgi:hypothetical protein